MTRHLDTVDVAIERFWHGHFPCPCVQSANPSASTRRPDMLICDDPWTGPKGVPVIPWADERWVDRAIWRNPWLEVTPVLATFGSVATSAALVDAPDNWPCSTRDSFVKCGVYLLTRGEK